ncbi:hypothetical protein ACFFV7_40360 [Nonomuraea spiralis]|uniref:Uncharacterized protein n=1 Tax=Nonomuraea spiralis TaxID=46182 RepID=A0ABV5ISG7_9ACTN|nr:hypothetical protein [Nonomuraea spiralis]GGT39958.1 hypothetical protein GCM10010176_099870 [Nonomuraea spiralis]
MSTNERDWFSPRTDQHPEDPPPPPPSGPPSPQGPPPEAGAPQAPLPGRPRRRRAGTGRDRATPPPSRPTPPPGYGGTPGGYGGVQPGPGGASGPGAPGTPGGPGGPRGAQAAGAGQAAFGQGAPAGPGFGQGVAGRGRYVHPDQQVWPPAQRESSGGSSTQPLPAIRPGMPAPPPQQTQPHGGGPSEPPAGGPRQNAPQPKRSRLILVAVGAAVASVVAMGLNAYDGYGFYDTTVTDGIETKVIAVAPGQAGKVFNIEWKAALTPTPAPPGSKHGAEVTWLKVDITQKLLDEANATMIAPPDKARLEDRSGRTWTVEFDPGDRPTDRLELGKEYRIEGLAIVPAQVANEVELSFRTSDYRSDTPTQDFFKRDKVGPPVANVLLFRRR